MRDLAKAAADASPDANILVISNPVNSTVPIVAEVFKSKGVYNPKRIFGVTSLDVVRASRFISQLEGTDPSNEFVPVVGGHSGVTIVPLLSQSNHPGIDGEKRDALVNRIQFGGDEVVKAKEGAGSATLSMAYAGAHFASSLLRAANGEKGVIEPTYIDSPLYKDQGVDFFASKVELGPDGASKILEVGKLPEYEEKLLEASLDGLKKNIKKGISTSPYSVIIIRLTTWYRCRLREEQPIKSIPFYIDNEMQRGLGKGGNESIKLVVLAMYFWLDNY